ncbi:MAG: type II toxin-antitoxin system Phd/YefM family antitoxin [Anaerolineaceae bacterium]|nr:type II toxin-antitoxin system Phd/YefM family antitoxin [Anaerolineaceae bacterium]
MNNIWQLQEAKAKFSDLVSKTLEQGVQIITRRGKNTVVVMDYDEYERLTKKDMGLSQYLLSSPLLNSELTITRDKSMPRLNEIEP